ncbi:Uncharacterised protein [Neisseria meningitidis]|nr:Uncharacterised protein [Neisseria meningitidis]
MRHNGAGIKLHQGFEDAADVGVFFGQAEDAHTAHAVERFNDDVAVFFQKCADIGGTGRYQRGRGKAAEVQNRQFFIEITHRLSAVKDLRALLLRQRQKLCGVEVLHIERRIGTHNHGIKCFQCRLNFVGGGKPVFVVVVLCAEKLKSRRISNHQTVFNRQFPAQGMKQPPTAFCHLAHHGVGGVFVGFETCHRVGDKEDFHHISFPVCRMCRISRAKGKCRPNNIQTARMGFYLGCQESFSVTVRLNTGVSLPWSLRSVTK